MIDEAAEREARKAAWFFHLREYGLRSVHERAVWHGSTVLPDRVPLSVADPAAWRDLDDRR